MNSAVENNNKQEKISLRIDVDYAFPSRTKSFFFTFIGKKLSNKDYLRNSKIIVKMINESPKEVNAIWFFTPYTLPDSEMLNLLGNNRHEIGLHVAKNANKELENLQKLTPQKIKYYTNHGTERFLGQIIWKRKRGQKNAYIPPEFPLQNLWDLPTFCFDRESYGKSIDQILPLVQKGIEEKRFLHIHPDWLFHSGGKTNHRGPYYETLKVLLQVDKDLDGLAVKKKAFFKKARFSELNEYLTDHHPSEGFLKKVAERDVDLLSIIDRSWCNPLENPSKDWRKEDDNVALLKIDSYDVWWEGVGKKTRNMVRKAEKSGVTVQIVEPSDKLAEGIWKIYNETPIRQGRAFPHYGQNLETVKGVFASKTDTFIGASLNDEVVGFIQLAYGDNIAIISQILSLQQHWDKAINNALIAKAVEVCSNKKVQWVMYGRIGNHPSLDKFKENNNFVKYPLTRYYIPLSLKGRFAVALGLHRNFKDAIPEPIKKRLLGVYSWVSRTRGKHN